MIRSRNNTQRVRLFRTLQKCLSFMVLRKVSGRAWSQSPRGKIVIPVIIAPVAMYLYPGKRNKTVLLAVKVTVDSLHCLETLRWLNDSEIFNFSNFSKLLYQFFFVTFVKVYLGSNNLTATFELSSGCPTCERKRKRERELTRGHKSRAIPSSRKNCPGTRYAEYIIAA